MKKFAKSQRMKPLNLINIGLDEDFDDHSKIFNHNVNANGAISAMGNGRFNHKLHNFCPDIHDFSWDPDNSSKEITFSSDYRHAFLQENNYLFRTMLSNRPFMDG